MFEIPRYGAIASHVMRGARGNHTRARHGLESSESNLTAQTLSLLPGCVYARFAKSPCSMRGPAVCCDDILCRNINATAYDGIVTETRKGSVGQRFDHSNAAELRRHAS